MLCFTTHLHCSLRMYYFLSILGVADGYGWSGKMLCRSPWFRRDDWNWPMNSLWFVYVFYAVKSIARMMTCWKLDLGWKTLIGCLQAFVRPHRLVAAVTVMVRSNPLLVSVPAQTIGDRKPLMPWQHDVLMTYCKAKTESTEKRFR
jgi:hypothetical protein